MCFLFLGTDIIKKPFKQLVEPFLIKFSYDSFLFENSLFLPKAKELMCQKTWISIQISDLQTDILRPWAPDACLHCREWQGGKKSHRRKLVVKPTFKQLKKCPHLLSEERLNLKQISVRFVLNYCRNTIHCQAVNFSLFLVIRSKPQCLILQGTQGLGFYWCDCFNSRSGDNRWS